MGSGLGIRVLIKNSESGPISDILDVRYIQFATFTAVRNVVNHLDNDFALV